jgi:flagellar hook assembly protein FlgD
VRLTLAAESEVTLRIYRVDGALVRTILQRPLTGGAHLFGWDGRDDAGRRAPPGVYIVSARVGKKRLTAKLVHLGR